MTLSSAKKNSGWRWQSWSLSAAVLELRGMLSMSRDHIAIVSIGWDGDDKSCHPHQSCQWVCLTCGIHAYVAWSWAAKWRKKMAYEYYKREARAPLLRTSTLFLQKSSVGSGHLSLHISSRNRLRKNIFYEQTTMYKASHNGLSPNHIDREVQGNIASTLVFTFEKVHTRLSE